MTVHAQYEMRHFDYYAGCDWSAWGIGVEAHYDDADNGSVWATVRIGPAYFGDAGVAVTVDNTPRPRDFDSARLRTRLGYVEDSANGAYENDDWGTLAFQVRELAVIVAALVDELAARGVSR